MADVIRDVVVRIGIEQKEQRIKAPGVSDAVKELDKLKHSSLSAADEMRNLDDAIKQMHTDLKASEEAIISEQQALTQAIEANSAAIEQAFSQAAQSTLRLGRAISLLGASGSKDMQELIRSVVRIQAAYDGLEAAIDIVNSLVKAKQALIAAESAHAAVMALAKPATAGVLILLVGTWEILKKINRETERKIDLANKERDAQNKLAKTNIEIDRQYQDSHRATLNRAAQMERREKELQELSQARGAGEAVGIGDVEMRPETKIGFTGGTMGITGPGEQPERIEVRDEQAILQNRRTRLEMRQSDRMREQQLLQEQQADVEARHRERVSRIDEWAGATDPRTGKKFAGREGKARRLKGEAQREAQQEIAELTSSLQVVVEAIRDINRALGDIEKQDDIEQARVAG